MRYTPGYDDDYCRHVPGNRYGLLASSSRIYVKSSDSRHTQILWVTPLASDHSETEDKLAASRGQRSWSIPFIDREDDLETSHHHVFGPELSCRCGQGWSDQQEKPTKGDEKRCRGK